MVELKTHLQHGETIKYTTIEGKLWFLGSDVARFLGYANPSNTVSQKVRAENKVSVMVKDAKYLRTIITEEGVYDILRSCRTGVVMRRELEEMIKILKSNNAQTSLTDRELAVLSLIPNASEEIVSAICTILDAVIKPTTAPKQETVKLKFIV